MSDRVKKPVPESAASPDTSSPPAAQQAAKESPTAKGPVISRRAFVIGAMGVSALLTLASISQSPSILGPLVPTEQGPTVIGNYQTSPLPNGTDLNSRYVKVKGTSDEYTPTNYSDFFYFPYPVQDSPYYKNIIVRLPDPLINPYYPDDPILQHIACFNLTCVHLRCIVNPGYAGNPGSGEFRLQCPCHGSQYRLTDAHPVYGPAYDLGLLPLPRVVLSADHTTGNITATSLDGQAGIGRTD